MIGKDPGHFVGKGWMERKFDRMVIEPRTIIPVSARVRMYRVSLWISREGFSV